MTSAKSKPWTDESRRCCLKQAATLADSVPLASALGAAVGAATAAAVSLSVHAQGAVDASKPEAAPSGFKGCRSSSRDEAAFVKALVKVMYPANELTPNGVDCGLATFIDRQLAGGYRSGAARVIKDVIDNTPDMTSAALRLFEKSATRDRLQAVFPDQETYNDLARTLLAETAFQQVRNTVLAGSPGRRPLSAEIPMIIERFDRRALDRLAAELHRQAQDIAEASDLSFADQRTAHPGPENLLKGGRHERRL